MSWYKISQLNRKIPYLGQCNHLRCIKGNEVKWQKMMDLKQSVSLSEITSQCDIYAVLDEDETLEDWKLEDPNSGGYKSMWGDSICYFFQTSGFEFIWADIR